MTYDAAVRTPIILFGAFDRHNFGDLLLPHIAAALMPGHRWSSPVWPNVTYALMAAMR